MRTDCTAIRIWKNPASRTVVALTLAAACTAPPETDPVANKTPVVSATPAATPAMTPSPTPSPRMIKPTGGGEFTKRSHTTPNGTLPYRLFVPVEYDASRRYPLIIWLHGAGGSGTDNKAQIEGDQVAGTAIWARPETQKTNPSFVFVPQTNVGWELDAAPTAVPSPESLPLVLQVVDLLAAELPIDASRVYLLGQSMGGGGVWELVTQHTGRFAAAVLVCPVVSNPERAAKAARLPMWLFVGDQDGLATTVRGTVELLRKAGGTPRFTEYEGEGHNIWTRVFKEPELVPWLFAQTR